MATSRKNTRTQISDKTREYYENNPYRQRTAFEQSATPSIAGMYDPRNLSKDSLRDRYEGSNVRITPNAPVEVRYGLPLSLPEFSQYTTNPRRDMELVINYRLEGPVNPMTQAVLAATRGEDSKMQPIDTRSQRGGQLR